MTAMANMGNLVVALPPSDIWLTDEQAADFLGYANTYFKASIICLKGFPKPRYIMTNSKGRRWNLKMLSDWLSERPDDLKIKRFKAFQKNFPKLCKKHIAKITTDDFVTWRDERLKKVKPASVRREGNILSALFTVARTEWKWVYESPMSDLKMPPPPAHRDRRITEDEVERLCLAADFNDQAPENFTQQIMIAFLLAIETAMRAGEIRGLTWDRVYLKDRYVTLDETKNGTKRHVPLSKRAVELLELMKGISSHNVFTVKDASFDTLWRKLRDKCEIEDLHFHDSRHEACTRLARKLEVLDLARMIGHKDLRSLMVYYNATASEIANRLD